MPSLRETPNFKGTRKLKNGKRLIITLNLILRKVVKTRLINSENFKRTMKKQSLISSKGIMLS